MHGTFPFCWCAKSALFSCVYLYHILFILSIGFFSYFRIDNFQKMF
nr:MAG TPA: hypothetical protein [Caudoviricetes sp.]